MAGFGPLISGSVFLWLSRNEQLDWAISNSGTIPPAGISVAKQLLAGSDQPPPAEANSDRRGGTDAVLGIYRRSARLIVTMLLIGIGPLVVGILKATSAHSCPWDLIEYGGKAMSFPLFGAVPALPGPGRCFPAGTPRAVSRSWRCFSCFIRSVRASPRWCWCGGIALGMVMGFGQIMRGAHFLTHNLWAGWWVWLTSWLFIDG